MKYLQYLGYGICFALGAIVTALMLDPTEDRYTEWRPDKDNRVVLKEVKPSKLEDRLVFNALLTNNTDLPWYSVSTAVELYDENKNLITSCNEMTIRLGPKEQRHIVHKCSLPGFEYYPKFTSINSGVLFAEAMK